METVFIILLVLASVLVAVVIYLISVIARLIEALWKGFVK